MPLEGHFLVADDEIAVINHLGSDVNAVLNLEVDEVGLSVFDLVEGWFFWGGTLDVCKRLVVIDHRDKERLASGLLIQFVVEQKFLLIVGFVLVYLFGGARLGGMNLAVRLSVKSLQFLLVSFSLTCSNIALQSGRAADA